MSSSSLSLSEDGVERRFCRELFSPSSKDQWMCGDTSDSPSDQSSSSMCLSRSDSLEGCPCPPLPGQVSLEPTDTSNGPTAQGALEASRVNRSSTGEIEIRLGSVKCTYSSLFHAELLQVCSVLISGHIYRCSAE